MSEIDKIVEAYSDENFQKLIQKKLVEIESILNEFIQNESSFKISKKIVSRIKDKDSLREKLSRKNYIEDWQLDTSNNEKIQDSICKQLPDLVGFRINCYFKNEEEPIWKKLNEYLRKKENIAVEENPNINQKNGHNIYKTAYKYKEMSNIFSFEIQVKSMLHDIWGEVEHHIVYKKKSYDSRQNLKTSIIEGIYTILEGVDKQLNKLYSFNNNLNEIKRELFFEYSKENININHDILGEHYENFFKIIHFISNYQKCIDEYLGNRLLEKEFCRKKIEDIDISIKFKEYEEKLDKNKWETLCQITSTLYDYENEDILFKNIIQGILNIAFPDSDEDFINEDSTDEDSTDEDDSSSEFNIIMKSLDCIRKK